MFFIALVSIILLAFIATVRFPKFTSRISSRLPRFRLFRFFKNKKIKTLLSDRYFFNQYTQTILEKKLYIVVGQNAFDVEKALSRNNDPENHNSQEKKYLEVFKLKTIFNSHFVFLNPSLLSKIEQENFNSRIKIFLNRLCQFRKQNFISGIIYLASDALEKPVYLSKEFESLSDEIEQLACIYAQVSKNLKFDLPIIFLQDNGCLEASKNQKKELDENFTKKTGFYYKFPSEPLSKNSFDLVKDQFIKFKDDFNFQMKRKLHESLFSIKNISISTNAQAEMLAAIQSEVRMLLKKMVTLHAKPDSLFFINTKIFNPNMDANLNNVFGYIAENCHSYLKISNKLIYNKIQQNKFMGISAILLSSVLGFCLLKGFYEIKLQEREFLQASEELHTLEKAIDDISYIEENLKLNTLHELAAEIRANFSKINSIPMKSFFLFPSWTAHLSEKIQEKYKQRFGQLYSDMLIEKYIENANSLLNQKIITESNSQKQFEKTTQYLSFFLEFNEIYALLMSEKVNDVQLGLGKLTQIIYHESLEEQKNFSYFLESISAEKRHQLEAFNLLLKNSHPDNIKHYFENYFELIFENSLFLKSAQQLNLNLNKLSKIPNKLLPILFEKGSEKERAIYKNHLRNSMQNYQNLVSAFSKNYQEGLDDYTNFIDTRYPNLLRSMESDASLGKRFANEINLLAKNKFKIFYDQLFNLVDNTEWSILQLDENNQIFINQKVDRIFQMLTKVNEIYPFVDNIDNIDNLEISDAQKFQDFYTKLRYPHKWDQTRLQLLVKNQIKFQESYSHIDYDRNENNFADFLDRFLISESELQIQKAFVSAAQFLENEESHSEEYTLNKAVALNNSEDFLQIFRLPHLDNYKVFRPQMSKVYQYEMNHFLKEQFQKLEKEKLFGDDALLIKTWDGQSPLLQRLFNVQEHQSLEEKMQQQRNSLLNFYSKNVETPLKTMTKIVNINPEIHSYYYEIWLSIANNLEEKINTYAEFQQFAFQSLQNLTADNCFKTVKKPISLSNFTDYFEFKKQNIQNIVRERCRTISIENAIIKYEDFAESFDEYWAQKYPFIGNIDSYVTPDIRRDELDLVFKKFAYFTEERINFLQKESKIFSDNPQVYEFIKNIDNFKKIIKIEPQTKENTIQAYFKFRTERHKEQFANRIVDWELIVGNQKFGSRFGQPENVKFDLNLDSQISLKFSFENSTPLKNMKNFKQGVLESSKDSITNYSVGGLWSLLRIMDRYSECRVSSNCIKNRLRFEIPLLNGQKTVLFCDVSFIDSLGQKVEFPRLSSTAPHIKQSTPNF